MAWSTDKKYNLEILTPMKSAFKGEIEYVMAAGADGYFGVLVNHAPMLAALNFGQLYLRAAGGEGDWYVISNGFFEVRSNKASLLVDTCELKKEIDVERAKRAKERAEKRLKEREAGVDTARAEAALQRALVRLKTAAK
jgi:F-type H+-transporting ATPase subunit epsilon